MKKSKTTWILGFLFLIGVFLLFIGFSQINNRHIQNIQMETFQNETTSVQHIDQESLKNKPVPVTISIPKFHLVAQIHPVGLDQDGRMATIPNAEVIAWYAYGSSPGQTGNSILAGHRDWNGTLGSFWNLGNLAPNDTISIKLSNGQDLNFQVYSVHTYLLQDVPVEAMSTSGEARTTLITCAGDFVRNQGGYQSRVVAILHEANSPILYASRKHKK